MQNELGDVLVDTQPDAARILRGALAMLDRREAAIGGLRGVLNERPADDDVEDRKDSVASRRAEAAITLRPCWAIPNPSGRCSRISPTRDSAPG